MDIVLHPRAAPSARIRIWIGAFQTTTTPTLKWFLDGAEREPIALRKISSVRANEILSRNSPPEDQLRVFAGVYEFTGLSPDEPHTIEVEADGLPARFPIKTWTLPSQVPASLDGSFNVLLVSCFHQYEDRQRNDDEIDQRRDELTILQIHRRLDLVA